MIDFRKVATIQAWSALVWGVVLLVIPSPILGILAIQADPSDLLLARLAGAMLFALAASLIVARDTTEEDQRSRLAFGNATADLAMVIVIGAATRQITWRGLYECILETLRTTAMLMFIIVGAWIFAYFVVQTRLPVGLIELVKHFDLAPWAVIMMILVFYIILGCVLDAVAIILVTVPVFLPVATALGYDSVWYGILMVVVVEIGLITPPVGLNIFVMRAQLPDILLTTMFRGIAPFLVADAILIALLLLFPQIALWLPQLLYG